MKGKRKLGHSGLRQAFLHFRVLKGHNQVFQLPHQDTVQIVGGVADAVVCQTVLREVVCAYLFFTACRSR